MCIVHEIFYNVWCIVFIKTIDIKIYSIFVLVKKCKYGIIGNKGFQNYNTEMRLSTSRFKLIK